MLLHAARVGRLVWNGAFLDMQDTWRETFHAITADTTLAGAGRGWTGGVRNRGNEDGQAHGRAHLRTRQLRVHQKHRGMMPAANRRQTPAGQWWTVDRGAHDHSRTWRSGRVSQPIATEMTVHNVLQQWDQSFGILHSTEPVGKTLVQSQIKGNYIVNLANWHRSYSFVATVEHVGLY